MRSLLTGGIKAILAIAALSTAAHWALRLQRDAEGLPAPVMASLADPETTGSIAPRQTALPAPEALQTLAPAPVAAPAADVRPARSGLDQSHLAALIATATAAPKAKVAKR
ncbi:hypothetical protein [Methylobacterium persicinum]|uniref:Uncharacterized protein n=1 Tax=Methylobacterium persicinum TaxID=374426 RepID=A0ABU0HLH0_9HYPH|nr:hypothetical protein [Methylobacterium persicinum]MDQ0443160.1 hypothetical protein [Methylobacterium persicinum]GJE38262.1 hypothetical protein KHHGKMAE_2332 [Methylobacterium persicinum]